MHSSKMAWLSFPLIALVCATGWAERIHLPAWVMAPPARETQIELSVADRGMNPCLTADAGFGDFRTWSRAPLIGQMIIPKNLRAGQKTVDVVVHFHGHEAARKEFVKKVKNTVLVGIDLGNGSGAYLDKFGDPNLFEGLLKSVEAGVRKETGLEHIVLGKVGITSWSAGYGAVLRILSTDYGQRRVDSVALLDGLHTGYGPGGELETAKLQSIVDFAKRAVRGEKLMYVSHSSIVPPGYASTTETANYLVYKTGGKPSAPPAGRSFPMGLDLISTYSKGNFTMRGFRGNGKLDHCAHFGLLGEVVQGRFVSRWH